jgi:hypothetical protein
VRKRKGRERERREDGWMKTERREDGCQKGERREDR